MIRLVLYGISLQILLLSSSFTQTSELKVGEVTRTFNLTLPENYNDDETYPLVLVLHGYHDKIDNIGNYTQFNAKAKKERFIAVYPRGTVNENGYYIWNAGSIYESWTNNADDVGFIRSLIKHLSENYSVDASQIYVTGHSNGAMMAYRIAKNLSEIISAAACVSGPMVDEEGNPAQSVPIMHIHGDSDIIVPHTGTAQYGFMMPPIDKGLKLWIDWNKCSTVPAILKYNKKLTALQWNGDATIHLYLIHGQGHDWPNKERGGWQATDHIWEFFKMSTKN